jgi:hypothetical protein
MVHIHIFYEFLGYLLYRFWYFILGGAVSVVIHGDMSVSALQDYTTYYIAQIEIFFPLYRIRVSVGRSLGIYMLRVRYLVVYRIYSLEYLL